MHRRRDGGVTSLDGMATGAARGRPRERASRRPASRTRRHPRRGGALRRPPPLLAALLSRVSEQHGPLVARLAHLRAFRRGRLHRAVRVLAGHRPLPVGDGSFAASVSSHGDAPGGSCRRTGPPSRSAWPSPGGSSPNRTRTSRRRSPWRSTGSSFRTSSARPARTGRSGRSLSRPSCTSCSHSSCLFDGGGVPRSCSRSMTAIVVMTAAVAPHDASCRHAHAADAPVRGVVHGRHRRRRDPRRIGSGASASLALAGTHRGRPGRARDRGAGIGVDRRQLHLGRPGAGARHRAAARGGRRRQADAPRTPAREQAAAATRAHAPTACTSRTHRSW